MRYVQLFGTKLNLISVLQIVSNMQKLNHKISIGCNGFFKLAISKKKILARHFLKNTYEKFIFSKTTLAI